MAACLLDSAAAPLRRHMLPPSPASRSSRLRVQHRRLQITVTAGRLAVALTGKRPMFKVTVQLSLSYQQALRIIWVLLMLLLG